MAKMIGTMLAALLLVGAAGCSDGGSNPTPDTGGSATPTVPEASPDADASPDGTSATPSGEAPPDVDAAGPDGDIPAGCDLTNKRLAVVVRDWERVVGSIGRGDHSTYTGDFAKEIVRLQDRAEGCPGSSRLSQLVDLAARIDARADEPDLELYAEAVDAGDAWLSGLGFDNLRLAPS